MEHLMSAIHVMTHISHPFIPSVEADVMSIDELCTLLQTVVEQKKRLQTCEYECRQALTLLTSGDTQTRHLEGGKFTAKITMPKPSWSQPVLKDLWKDPEVQETGLAATYLRVAKIDPQLREVDKLRRTDGNELFNSFKAKLLSAEQPPTGVPTVTVTPKE